MAGPEASQQATIDWRRLAAEENVAIDVARGLWEQAKAVGGDPVARSNLFRRLLDDAARNPGAVQEPGKSTLVESKGPTDPASLGPGKTTRALLEAQTSGATAKLSDAADEAAATQGKDAAATKDAAGAVPGADASKKGDSSTAPPTVGKLHSDLVAAAQASQDVFVLLSAADPATIMEALKQLRAGPPTTLQKVLEVAGTAIEGILGKQLPNPAQANADGPPGIRVPFLGGEGEVHTVVMSDDGVPLVSASTPVAQKVADWRADILKRPPADQETFAPTIARASGLNTSAGDQAKKAKLGDEPAKAALPETQKQLAATLGTISRELAKPPQPAAPPASPAAAPTVSTAAATPSVAASAVAAEQPGAVAPSAPDAQQAGATQSGAQQAAAEQPTASLHAGAQPATQQPVSQQSATPRPATQQPATQQLTTQQLTTQQPADPASATQEPVAAQVPLAYDTYASHIRGKFGGEIAELDRMHRESIASGAVLKRVTQKLELTLEDVSKLKKQYDETKAELDEQKRLALEAQIAAQSAALPNAGMRMAQLLEKAKQLGTSVQGAVPPVKNAKAELEGVMQASMLLAAQVDPAASEAGRGLYVKIDTEENPSLVAKARDSGLPAEQVARMAVSQRNWLRQLWRTEVMKDENAAEILFLRDLGKEGQRTGLTFEQVQAKQIAKLQTVDPETKQAALRADFTLATATPAELDRIYAAIIASAAKTNAGVNANSGVGANAPGKELIDAKVPAPEIKPADGAAGASANAPAANANTPASNAAAPSNANTLANTNAPATADAAPANAAGPPVLEPPPQIPKFTPEMAVQSKPANEQPGNNISPEEQSALMQKPGFRTVDLAKMGDRDGPKEAVVKDNAATLTNLDDPAATSAADNPEFEKDALAFEKALGGYAYGHSAATGVINAMAAQCVTYFTTVLTKWDQGAKRLEEVLHAIGMKDAWYVGGVGKEIDRVREAFVSGPMHVKWAHVHHFFEDHLIVELQKKPNEWDLKFEEAVTNAKMDFAAMTKRRDQLQNADGEVTNNWGFADWDMMNGQKNTRAKESKDPSSSSALGKKASEIGVQMSPGEVAFQQEAAAAEKQKAEQHNAANPTAAKPVPAGTFNPETDAPRWASGSKGWLMNERDTWVRRQREMSIPLAAGPSGHTAVMMNVGKYFNQDVYKIRLAAIGNLLPFGHHTLVEVLTSAAAFGAGFTPGKEMYTNIQPLGLEELRNLGGGRFPHEPRPEKIAVETTEKKA